MSLKHWNKLFFAAITPWCIFVFYKLQLAKRCVVPEWLGHYKKCTICNITQVKISNVLVYICCFNYSKKTIFVKINLFKTQFVNWVIWIGNQGVSKEDTCLGTQLEVSWQVELCNVNRSFSLQGILKWESRLHNIK